MDKGLYEYLKKITILLIVYLGINIIPLTLKVLKVYTKGIQIMTSIFMIGTIIFAIYEIFKKEFKESKMFRNVYKGIVAFLLFYNSYFFQYIPIYLFKIDISSIDNTLEVLLSSFSNSILYVIFYFMFRKELKKEFKKFIKNFGEYTDIGFKYWLVGLIVMFISNIALSLLLKGAQAGNEVAVQEMIKAFPIFMILNAGILAPMIEEILFRKVLKNIIVKKNTYIIASGFLFGLAHVIGQIHNPTDWLFIIPYGALGIAFAKAHAETDNIYTSIFIHMLHNIILVIVAI